MIVTTVLRETETETPNTTTTGEKGRQKNTVKQSVPNDSNKTFTYFKCMDNGGEGQRFQITHRTLQHRTVSFKWQIFTFEDTVNWQFHSQTSLWGQE